MSERIRLLIADDHPVVRDGLAALIAEEDDVTVVGCAADGEAALRLCAELAPDLVLMDIAMPVMDGIAATRRLKAQQPAIKVLVLTMQEAPEYVLDVMRAGAAGYVLKDVSSETLMRTIRSVHDGLFVFPPVDPQASADTPKTALTRTEVKVFVRMVRGVATNSDAQRRNSSSAIGRDLHMSVRTVEAHRANIRDKLGVMTPWEMVKYATDHGLIEPE
jgi:two-component system nitrate/nitrite response regulator NarL